MSLSVIAAISIIICLVCGAIIAVDICFRPQHMWIMNIVWPVTALYSGPLGLAFYFASGRSPQKKAGSGKQDQHHMMHDKPKWQSVLTGALHCGAGCSLGDLISSYLLLAFPVVLFGSKLYGEWAIDYLFAFAIGIIFQYFAIKPMRSLSAGKAVVAALKADALSLTSWQVGMYGWMAIATFLIFHRPLHASELLFWLMMQVGMLCGLLTAYPVNWWLIKSGIKEAM